MKKILALILIVGCIFAFASCNLLSGKDNTPTADVSSVQKAIDESAPVSAKITVVLNSQLGDLCRRWRCGNSYTELYEKSKINKIPSEIRGDNFIFELLLYSILCCRGRSRKR